MKKTVLFTALVLLGVITFAQEQIAVFPFEDMDKVFIGNESFLFYRRFSNEFVNKNNGLFRVVPRQDIEKLINTEAAFQLSDFSAKAKTAEMQRVLNGSQILSGYIGKRGNKVTISISLFTYPELEQLPGGVDLDVTNKDQLFDKIPDLVQSMMTAIAGRNKTNKTYKIGDFGPAGGYVFYDKGVFSNGWRYLEAAPAETEYTAQWGASRQDVAGTRTEVGFGKRNTEIIVEWLNAIGESRKAAQFCVSLNFDGYNDWFLPSKDELDLMYKNLKQKGLGNFKTVEDTTNWTDIYLSSSQIEKYSSWVQRFSSGSQGQWGKDSTVSVRAIRAF